VLEGIDDITSNSSTNPYAVPRVTVSARELIASYRQLIGRAHAAGVRIFGATLTQFAGSRCWTPAGGRRSARRSTPGSGRAARSTA
jgi:hypothetical protein